MRILNRDLAAAGIDKTDERGRTIDVHALRHTFGTLLSASGVAPRTAQAAMRHSKIDLTMNVYTDPKLLDIHGALNALPSLNAPTETKGNQATGTVGVSADVFNVVSMVSQVSDFPPALRTFEAQKQQSIMAPNMAPKSCPSETIQDDCSGLGVLPGEDRKRRKPRETLGFTGLLAVDPIGIEPTTSTLPVWRSPS